MTCLANTKIKRIRTCKNFTLKTSPQERLGTFFHFQLLLGGQGVVGAGKFS
jgi:hypothetical protein